MRKVQTYRAQQLKQKAKAKPKQGLVLFAQYLEPIKQKQFITSSALLKEK